MKRWARAWLSWLRWHWTVPSLWYCELFVFSETVTQWKIFKQIREHIYLPPKPFICSLWQWCDLNLFLTPVINISSFSKRENPPKQTLYVVVCKVLHSPEKLPCSRMWVHRPANRHFLRDPPLGWRITNPYPKITPHANVLTLLIYKHWLTGAGKCVLGGPSWVCSPLREISDRVRRSLRPEVTLLIARGLTSHILDAFRVMQQYTR